MKKIIPYIYVVIAVLGSTACSDFCCDCNTGSPDDWSGNFRLICDWQKLWKDYEKPEELELHFYHPTLAPVYDKVYSDTTYYELPEGKYHILAVSKDDPASFTGMDNYFTAQVVLPVRIQDSCVSTQEAPTVFLGTNTTTIVSGAHNESIIYPAILNYIIHFRFIINSIIPVYSCKAQLDGVQTSRMLYTKQPVYASASLPFGTKQKDNNIFYKKLSFLGFSPGTINQLTVELECADNITQQTSIDLTDRFDFTVSPIQECTITINVNAEDVSDSNVVITDWQPGINGDIELQ